MLTALKKEDFEKYIDWAYSLALDITRSSFPTYTDGIKTKQDFIETTLKSFTSDTRKILLFSDEEKVLGWINYYFIPEDNYISLEAFNIENKTETALREFENYCRTYFKGYTLYMGFAKENAEAISYFKENGYLLLETSLPTVFSFKNFKPINCSNKIIKINKDNYRLFEKIHKFTDSDMYWNSERILNNLSNWEIYYYDNKIKQAAIYFTGKSLAEIFGIDFSDNSFEPVIFKELLIKCLNVCYARGTKNLYFFGESNQRRILTNLGFRCLCDYNLYTLCLA